MSVFSGDAIIQKALDINNEYIGDCVLKRQELEGLRRELQQLQTERKRMLAAHQQGPPSDPRARQHIWDLHRQIQAVEKRYAEVLKWTRVHTFGRKFIKRKITLIQRKRAEAIQRCHWLAEM